MGEVPIPTIEEVLQELSRSLHFTQLDLRKGCHQIELSEDSKSITTFVTHKGLFRYKQIMFGITSAPEAYQNIIQQVLHRRDGTVNFSDDVIVYDQLDGNMMNGWSEFPTILKTTD